VYWPTANPKATRITKVSPAETDASFQRIGQREGHFEERRIAAIHDTRLRP
jgi:hypothetical protein